MSPLWMILVAVAILGVSGLPAFFAPPQRTTGQRASVLLMVSGGVLGLAAVAAASVAGETESLQIAWGLPWGAFAVTLDPVCTVFLALVFLVPGLASLYGLAYWRHPDHPQTAGRLALFHGVLAASMALVVLAADAVLFLIAWEAMALAAFFAATVEEDDPAVRRAGWVYLIATHLGTLCLIAMFALWRHATGSFALTGGHEIAAGLALPIFVLAVVGFGAKAGLMPLHVWLPGAHAGAPSHVSAVMSGVMLKMGVYGLVRMTMVVPVTSLRCGSVMLAIGVATGIGGIAFALAQHDLKRLLAYSSIENVGIITMGLGLALVGRSAGRTDLVVLGLGGALLHVWNHGLFKPLLFFGAGAIHHATQTREIDRLGGLARTMPRLAGLFLAGVVAICGLPPLNGFASEWLLYLGFFRTATAGGETRVAPAAAAAVALAMIGALALACFVKLTATAFLGAPRDAHATARTEAATAMLVPMAVLAGACVVFGLLPGIAAAPIDSAVRTWARLPQGAVPALLSLAPLGSLSLAMFSLAGIAGVAAAMIRLAPRAASREALTWDCGYAHPTSRMQYSGSSFARALVIQFRFVLWPKSHRSTIHGAFPAAASFKSAVPDPVLDRLLVPLFRRSGRWLAMARVLQQGQTQAYVLYVLATLIALLLWGPRP